jgi:hypothetical protein
MEQVNIKAFGLIDFINEKSDYQITIEMYASGIFLGTKRTTVWLINRIILRL